MQCTIVSKNKIIRFISGLTAFCVCFIFFSSVYDRSEFANVVFLETKKLREIPIYSVKREDKKIALTFNAAWDDEETDKLLDLLDEYKIKCTFFVVGSFVRQSPEAVTKMVRRGHETANHSDNHKMFSKLSDDALIAEIKGCENELTRLGITPTPFVRPPSGDYSSESIRTMRKAGYIPVQWSVDSIDWKNPDTKILCERVVSKTESGSIILLHLGAKNTYEALKNIIPTLIDKGFLPVKLSELVYENDYTVDANGMQIKN